MTEQLKPCPLCGHKTAPACLSSDEVLSHPSDQWVVVCDIFKGGCGAASGHKDTEAKAIAAWNTRAEQPEKAGMVMVPTQHARQAMRGCFNMIADGSLQPIQTQAYRDAADALQSALSATAGKGE